MSCLFEHRWMYDFRVYHVYRKCQFCNVGQRHVKNKGSAYTAWERVRERSHSESEQRQIVQKRTSRLDRLADSLGLTRIRTSNRIRTLARST